MNHIDILNRRLGEELGYVAGLPRFAWHYAPEQMHLVYDRDDRTLLRKSWADMAAPDGGTIGRAWVLAERKIGNASDHCGYGEGVRVAATGRLEYKPFLETARIAPPTDELNANYIWAIKYQMEQTLDDYMAEEKYTKDRRLERDRVENRERSAAEYDKYTGGFGNLEPGLKDGFLSWGGVGQMPLERKLQESVAERALP